MQPTDSINRVYCLYIVSMIKPVTRVVKSKKVYDRKKIKNSHSEE